MSLSPENKSIYQEKNAGDHGDGGRSQHRPAIFGTPSQAARRSHFLVINSCSIAFYHFILTGFLFSSLPLSSSYFFVTNQTPFLLLNFTIYLSHFIILFEGFSIFIFVFVVFLWKNKRRTFGTFLV